MSHYSSKTTKIGSIFFVFVTGILFLVSACTGSTQSRNREEAIQITDSLWGSLNQIKQKFTFKIDEIEERKHEMDSVLQWLRFADEERLTPEIKKQILQYGAIYRVYKGYASAYKNSVIKAEEYFYEIKALDKQVKKGRYDDDLPAFGKEFRRLNGGLTVLNAEVTDILARLNTVEPGYRRVADEVEAFAETLR
jgi:hypothetical protein